MSQKLFDANIAGARFRMDLQVGYQELSRLVQNASQETIRQVLETAGFKAAKLFGDIVSRLYRDGVPGHAALHPFTIQQKGFDQPLYETGQLSRSLRVRLISRRKARTDFEMSFPPGVDQIKAAIAEEGATLKVTAKRRRFLASRGLRLRASTRYLTIPPRPVFPVAIEEALPIMQESMQRDINREFGKIFRVR